MSKIAFRSHHEPTELVIVTELTANEETALSGVRKICHSFGIGGGIWRSARVGILPFQIPAAVANLSADVEPGPVTVFLNDRLHDIFHFLAAWQRLGSTKQSRHSQEGGEPDG